VPSATINHRFVVTYFYLGTSDIHEIRQLILHSVAVLRIQMPGTNREDEMVDANQHGYHHWHKVETSILLVWVLLTTLAVFF
jgi:hypothetical protein